MAPPPSRPLIGECLGTFLLVGLGTGTVASSVLLGWPASLAGVAALWGLAVGLAITVAAPLSGAHLNPAVSLALAVWRPAEFPRRRLAGYWGAQMAGAVLAGAAVLLIFGADLARFEAAEGLVRGAPGSERAAMVFGEYFPNPGMAGPRIAPATAALFEAAGTAVLLLGVFVLGDLRGLLARRLAPWLVGALVAAIIVVLAPATQSGLNPARDFGPRLVALAAGYGAVALPGPEGGFWVYIVGPLVGGVVGAGVHRLLFGEGRGKRPVVLFVCVHNAGRSQMAAAFTRLLGGDRVEIRSGGSAPGDRIHPGVVEAMREVAVDLSAERPRAMAPDDVRAADVVVTMGCGDACPVFPGRIYEDWAVPDPAGQPVEAVRPIRDAIRRRVEDLLARLDAGDAAVPR